MTHDEMIAVIQAHKDGKKLLCRFKETVEWMGAEPEFNFSDFEYKVKPEPIESYMYIFSGEASPIHTVANPNIKATFDPDTKKLVSVEMIK